jgi:flagellar motility protein MotE (MotC chaperone)
MAMMQAIQAPGEVAEDDQDMVIDMDPSLAGLHDHERQLLALRNRIHSLFVTSLDDVADGIGDTEALETLRVHLMAQMDSTMAVMKIEMDSLVTLISAQVLENSNLRDMMRNMIETNTSEIRELNEVIVSLNNVIVGLRNQIQAMTEPLDDSLDLDFRSLARMYNNMDTNRVAQLLQNMPPEVAVQILRSMNQRKAVQVMAVMPANVASRYSQLLLLN